LKKTFQKRIADEPTEKVRRLEQQLSDIQKITHLGSWEWIAATGRVECSDEMYRISGMEPNEIPASSRTLLEIVHPGDREAIKNLVQQAIGNCQPVNSHYFRLVRPDGSTRIIHGQLNVVFDDSWQPVSISGTCHDVTEFRWVEAALHASEQRFFTIFQSTPDLLSITSAADECYIEVNETFLRELGYQRTEIIGRSAHELGIWVEERERVGVAQALLDQGELRDLEVHFRTKTGRVIAGLASAAYLEINGQKSILTLFKDISERKLIEKDRSRLASIVESSNDAILATDLDGIITIWNVGAEKIFGRSAHEIMGRNLATLICGDGKNEIDLLPWKAWNDGLIKEYETVYLREDGRRIRILLNISQLKDEDGTIVGISGIARDITKRTEIEEAIKHQAHHDILTDLPNRKLFMDFLALELSQARRNRKNLAVLFLDLDRFKQINDTLGHAAGDLLLKAVAQRLKKCVRESDTVARIGGDEFNILMPDLNQVNDVGTVVGKIMGVFEMPFLLDNLEINATTSIGVSVFPNDGTSSEDLVQKADNAMYVAKQRNGNTYQFYNGEINGRTLKRQVMERQLRQAVQRNELELVFQPQVRTNTAKIISAEALLRWRHPEQGLLLPAQFLPVAEETGVIVPLGKWVIRTACTQMKEWQGEGQTFGVTVNLSSRQFLQPNFVEMMYNILAETGLGPQSLELDVTENTIMNDLDLSNRTLRKLTKLGVRFSVDDFGVGSSSMSCINKLPIDSVKIDRSFVKGILTDLDDLAVVKAIIAMSHNLKIKVNAVGVESQEQLSLLYNNGCDGVQGNLISKPLPAREFKRMVASLT
jgi:diguanylate cyclase (GGDEF)-like protein/PAS domain S-box-containing protein